MSYPLVSDDISDSLSVSAFTDSVDGGIYTTGVCGEKRVTLDAGSPSFLSIALDVSDPTLNPFSIDYDESQATEADVGVHTISYTI